MFGWGLLRHFCPQQGASTQAPQKPLPIGTDGTVACCDYRIRFLLKFKEARGPSPRHAPAPKQILRLGVNAVSTHTETSQVQKTISSDFVLWSHQALSSFNDTHQNDKPAEGLDKIKDARQFEDSTAATQP